MRPNGIRAGTERAALTMDPVLRERFLALHAGKRSDRLRSLPPDLGRLLAIVSTDIHGEVDRTLAGVEALPVARRWIDLGDKVDRGPNPLGANQLLEIMNPRPQRLVGNHDALWIGAGLGIPRLAIELVRWLMRYGEEGFVENSLGISLNPLKQFADQFFGDARGDYKSERSRSMEAAATYLKIIAEAPYRMAKYRDVALNESELRIRTALFHENDLSKLTEGEREIFDRLTGGNKLDERDADLFYRLMGGLHSFTPEEQAVIDYFKDAFLSNHAYFQIIECMMGVGEVYALLRMSEGAPRDMLFTHAGVPINADGSLAEFDGKTGKEAFDALEQDFQMALSAWRWFIETGDTALLEVDRGVIDRLGELPWGEQSPLYMRLMQTAARAVLPEGSGLFVEPTGPFYSKWIKSQDPNFISEVCRQIGASFNLNPHHLLLVHGHEPDKTKQGLVQVKAGGHDLNIDAGTAKAYGAKGAFLLVGTNTLYKYGLATQEFTPVDLRLDCYS